MLVLLFLGKLVKKTCTIEALTRLDCMTNSLILSLPDSIREMTKYSGDLNTDHHSGSRHVDAELQHSMKLFRAQRNFYIAGFALFLFLVIRRLVTLITALAQLDIQVEATMKQAKSASDAAKSMIKDDKPSADRSSGESKEVKKLKEQMEEKEKELQKLRSNVDALKRQATNLTEEYDRLNAEHQKVIKSKKAEGESKKDN